MKKLNLIFCPKKGDINLKFEIYGVPNKNNKYIKEEIDISNNI